MTAARRFVVHLAAPPAGQVQCCAACGYTLLDNSGWYDGRVALPDTEPDRLPSWWPAGAMVATDKPALDVGGVTYVVSDRPLAGDERYCAGTN